MKPLSQEELEAHGRNLGRSLPPGSVLVFRGEVGAGKTTFIKAIAAGLGVTEGTSSPTFSLVNSYPGRRGPVYHVDCYRMRDPEEARDLDWEGMLRDGDVVMIEWPDQAGPWVPTASHAFTLSHVEDPDLRLLETG